ncbi:MAG TPA: hypothetical protein VJG48_01585 [Candidatus Paceibacterota bacterium]
MPIWGWAVVWVLVGLASIPVWAKLKGSWPPKKDLPTVMALLGISGLISFVIMLGVLLLRVKREDISRTW